MPCPHEICACDEHGQSTMLSRTSLLASRLLLARHLSTRLPQATSTVGDLAPTLHRLRYAEDKWVLKSTTPVGDAATHLINHQIMFALVASVDSQEVVGMVTERNLLKFATRADDIKFFHGDHDPPVADWCTPVTKCSWAPDDTLSTPGAC